MIGADEQIQRRLRERALRVRYREPELYAAVGDEAWQECRTELLRELRRAVEGHEPADAELAEVVAEMREAAAPEAVEPKPTPPAARTTRARTSRGVECVAWLHDFLAPGPRLGRDVYAEAKRRGYSRRMVERARPVARVDAPNGPRSTWSLLG